jgi:hypothetical protein
MDFFYDASPGQQPNRLFYACVAILRPAALAMCLAQEEDYIQKVEVELHETFGTPNLVLTQPPFNVGRVSGSPGMRGRRSC